jgi:hypothetical protein
VWPDEKPASRLALDQLDGDLSLRTGGDAEPSLACPECRNYQVVWCIGGDDDREMG